MWRATPLCIFLDNLMETKLKSIKNKEKTDQMLKLSFLTNLSAWISMHIREGSMPLFDFVD